MFHKDEESFEEILFHSFVIQTLHQYGKTQRTQIPGHKNTEFLKNICFLEKSKRML